MLPYSDCVWDDDGDYDYEWGAEQTLENDEKTNERAPLTWATWFKYLLFLVSYRIPIFILSISLFCSLPFAIRLAVTFSRFCFCSLFSIFARLSRINSRLMTIQTIPLSMATEFHRFYFFFFDFFVLPRSVCPLSLSPIAVEVLRVPYALVCATLSTSPRITIIQLTGIDWLRKLNDPVAGSAYHRDQNLEAYK